MSMYLKVRGQSHVGVSSYIILSSPRVFSSNLPKLGLCHSPPGAGVRLCISATPPGRCQRSWCGPHFGGQGSHGCVSLEFLCSA